MPAHPCLFCNKGVHKNHHAVSCDFCSGWQHRKCMNTGVTTKQYRDAVRLGQDLAFICATCEIRIPPTVDNSDDESDVEVLTSGVMDGTYVIHREVQSDVEADTTIPPLDESVQTLNGTFNVVYMDIEESDEILESSLADQSLTTDIDIEDQPVTYRYFEKGSKRGGELLVSTDGYTYCVKKRNKSSVLWTCSVRGKALRCHAKVTQVGDDFRAGASKHVHPGDVGTLMKKTVEVEVKEAAASQLFRSAAELVDVAMKNIPSDQLQLPNPGLIARAANRYRQRMRPKEP